MQRSFSVPILGAALFIGAPVIPGGRLVAEKAPDPRTRASVARSAASSTSWPASGHWRPKPAYYS
jgi:hypothetical protein